ncbi:GspE/PulE family protein [Poseidonibacter lekithochrous]|uniref:GspE/PulE family protein n=1 Tax=Poseidonibacter TaxID=2321187 RepID=UPI001C08311A|nr:MULTISPECIES: GspE/PulE family protein [Poseidonibacter]MBU3015679.1 GspE/PulE family protein [Poseidonibacter lekithochrous]MDO6828980.1 GspE/PulE family protein [Poseidonibacter sp. 1_MG-2023]
MNNTNNILIDYDLFFIYTKEYFLKNKIIPIKEDDISLDLLVCKESNLNSVNTDFNKVLKYTEVDTNDLLFFLSFLDIKIDLYTNAKSIISLQKEEKKSVEKFLHTLINFSIQTRTSDIHIEKYINTVLFRFRVDGKLKTFFAFPSELLKVLSSYVKLISNIDITQTRLPQDSRFSVFINNETYDFRVSTMPTIESESIVIRILDKKNINKSIEDLGLSSNIYSILKKSLNLTQGLILVTGPTGAGKTTTLYSILQELNSSEKKIVTVEDPVEYKIDSISQIAVNNKIGLSFEIILRNILRQDPDIIFIGEIRDKLSLDIALQASLTGHLVLASIHSNNSVETISRLMDLDADPFLISSSLKLILSQRLVLNYCKFCDAKGCEKCNYTKYYDRSCIAEAMKIDEKISSMIFKKEDINDIRKYLKSIDFKTILDDGKEKVSSKITSIEEVLKVVNF